MSKATAHIRPDPVLEQLAAPTRRARLDALTRRLLDIQTWLARDLELIERELSSEAPGEDLAERAARHLLAQPGKRIRPLCVMLAARVGGRPFDAAVRDLAVAAELVHSATLLHDDVIDAGTERRGAPTSRIVYGNAASVLAGDHLLVEALRRVARAGIPALMPALLDTISEMVAAEAAQLAGRGRLDPAPDAYMRVIRGKTAALFQWALRAGGVASGLDDAAIDALGRVGLGLGTAFQLVDDALDFDGAADALGKGLLVDLGEGKMTWPLIVAMEAEPETTPTLLDAFLRGAVEIDAILDVIHRTRATEHTRAFARRHVERATEALSTLPAGEARDALEAVTRAALHRSH